MLGIALKCDGERVSAGTGQFPSIAKQPQAMRTTSAKSVRPKANAAALMNAYNIGRDPLGGVLAHATRARVQSGRATPAPAAPRGPSGPDDIQMLLKSALSGTLGNKKPAGRRAPSARR